MPQRDKWLLSNGQNKTGLIHLFVNFLKKYKRKVPIIINDGNIHGGLKMEFLHYNCFHAVTKKLIVGSYYMRQDPVEMLQSELKAQTF